MKHLTTILFIFYSFLINAQTEQVNSCGTEYILEKNYDSEFEDYFQKQTQVKAKNPVTYYIPIVFHVIHAGEQVGIGSNISDLEIYKALERLNNNYRNIHNNASGGDTSIQFVLATRAPDGSCSTGINRIDFSTNQAYVQYGNKHTSSNSGVDAVAIRALSNWNPNQYYNVWVVNKITSASGVAGYAYYATEHGKIHDGTFISYQSLIDKGSKTLTHELGHSLNLMHTFQGSTGTNCPAQINGCGADGDCIVDTPPHPQTHANDLVLTAANNCAGNNDSSYKHNYMSYASSQYRTVFTPLQITRMQSAITFYRSSYLPANNSVFKMTQVPQARFLINDSDSNLKRIYCIGTPISLTNTSTCFLNTFNNTTVPNYQSHWEIKRNGQFLFSTSDPSPILNLTQTGTYSITLTAMNNLGSNSVSKTDIIEIISAKNTNYCAPTSTNTGYFGLSVNNVKLHSINNSTAIGVNNAYSDFSCSHITQVAVNHSNAIDITVSNNNSNVKDNMLLQGYIDYNQNNTFEANEMILQQSVPSATNNKVYTFNFTPPANVKKGTVLRMRIISERTNITTAKLNCTTPYNIGDVEDYGVIFIDNLANEDFETVKYSIFPNPVANTLNITSGDFSEKQISIYSTSGKLVKTLKTSSNPITIDVSSFATGTYILNINNTTHKFIKE